MMEADGYKNISLKGKMYAEKTRVPIDQSKAEIEKILAKYGASSFGYVTKAQGAVVMFEVHKRRIQFTLPLPEYPSDNATNRDISDHQQLCRSKWRSLVLCIKSKLESVSSGITTLEQEFMAHIVLPSGVTVGQVMIPQIEKSYETNKMPPLLMGSED